MPCTGLGNGKKNQYLSITKYTFHKGKDHGCFAPYIISSAWPLPSSEEAFVSILGINEPTH